MAFAARLGPLVGELIEALTSASAEPEPPTLSLRRDAALRTLKPHSYLRTNQFQVANNLSGLEERFRVNGRDDLADALRERLDTAHQQPPDWLPDILHLLLELSDQPTDKTKLGDLDLLRIEKDSAETPLRWEDIANEDGWHSDDMLWKSVSYSGDDDSDDPGQVEGESTAESEVTSLFGDGDGAARAPGDYILQPEHISTLESVRKAQEWRDADPLRDASGNLRKTPVPETQVVREVLFMLQGMESSLFDAKVNVAPNFQILHVAWQTHQALLATFAELGLQLEALRAFVRQTQAVPHLQSLQDCVTQRLDRFDNQVSQVQSKFVLPRDGDVVSLLSVKGDLEPLLEPLIALSRIIVEVLEAPDSDTFLYLELIFDEISMAQLTGRLAVYEFLAQIFVECFGVYLRPIRHWMDHGKLLPGSQTFFVHESAEKVPLADVWQRKFSLRRAADGEIHAPKFLRPAVNRIYNAGKNIVVLRLLGRHGLEDLEPTQDEAPLDYNSICPEGFDLAPFRDLFGAAFDRWIHNKYRKTSTTLKEALFGDLGLSHALDSLRGIYLMSDGTAAASFCEDVFESLDAMNPKWHDRFALTTAAHEAFASLADLSRLSVSSNMDGRRLSAEAARDSVRTGLATIEVQYRLSWPLQMILSQESMTHYQSIFTLLLQIRRALHLLCKPRILDNYQADHVDWAERATFYASRNSLIWFCTTLQTYLSTQVLAPNDLRLRQGLRMAQDVDAMIAVHASCMKQNVDQVCLGSRLEPIRDCILGILDLAIKLERTYGINSARKEEDDSDGEESGGRLQTRREKIYLGVMRDIKTDFDRQLRFICGGLRSVARASNDSCSGKWDILADMLQMGIQDGG